MIHRTDPAFDVEDPDCVGRTRLHRACMHGDAGRVEALLDAGANVHARTCTAHTPLHLAADRGAVSAVKLLLDAGADPNATAHGRTPYGLARRNRSQEVAMVLEAAGADVDGATAALRD